MDEGTMQAFRAQLEEHDTALYGSSTVPGIFTRLDRLERRTDRTQACFQAIRVAFIGFIFSVLGGTVLLALQGWFPKK